MDPGAERMYRKYLEQAKKLLLPDEKMLDAVYVSFGLKPGVLALTEERIVLCHAATSAFGVRRAEMRLADVESVRFTKGNIRDGTRNQVTISSEGASLHPLAHDESEGRRWAEAAAGQLEKFNHAEPMDLQPDSPLDSPPQPGNLAQQLAQLAELHGQGALSDREFEAAKSKLLGLN
jgi:Short C-terminal domain/Bacterial PH domain